MTTAPPSAQHCKARVCVAECICSTHGQLTLNSRSPSSSTEDWRMRLQEQIGNRSRLKRWHRHGKRVPQQRSLEQRVVRAGTEGRLQEAGGLQAVMSASPVVAHDRCLDRRQQQRQCGGGVQFNRDAASGQRGVAHTLCLVGETIQDARKDLHDWAVW